MAEDTDLTLGVNGRTWIASQGLRNFPDGEVFTGPVEDETNGEVRFSFPAIIGGREVNGVRLVFENGRVVHSEADQRQSYLHQMLSIDDGASVLGELAIGTNYGVTQFTKQILFDEKIGGTCHMALGVGYPDTGSLNKSALHWDMVRDLRSGGEIHADGELIYRDGRSFRRSSSRRWRRPTAVARHAGASASPCARRAPSTAGRAGAAPPRPDRRRPPSPRRCLRATIPGVPAARRSPPCASRPAAAGSRGPSSVGQPAQRLQVGRDVLPEPEAGVDQDSARGDARGDRRLGAGGQELGDRIDGDRVRAGDGPAWGRVRGG